MPEVTVEELRGMSPQEVAALDRADVNRALAGGPPVPESAEDLRAMTPQQIADLDPAVVNGLLAGGAS